MRIYSSSNFTRPQAENQLLSIIFMLLLLLQLQAITRGRQGRRRASVLQQQKAIEWEEMQNELSLQLKQHQEQLQVGSRGWAGANAGTADTTATAIRWAWRKWR